MVAYKKTNEQTNRSDLIYVDFNDNHQEHLVSDRKFNTYYKLRKNVPALVILFSTQKELITEVKKRGYLV